MAHKESASCSNGLNGHNGLPGRDGRNGVKGEKGVAGPSGSRGVKGDVGPKGSDADHKNWKQCAWKAEDNRDIGLIRVCVDLKSVSLLCQFYHVDLI